MPNAIPLDKNMFAIGMAAGNIGRNGSGFVEEPLLPTNDGNFSVSWSTSKVASLLASYMPGIKRIGGGFSTAKQFIYTTKKTITTAKEMLSINIGEAQGVRGSYVDIPIYIKDNRSDNRYVAGFQLDCTWDSNYLSFVSATATTEWGGTTVVETSESGHILLSGYKTIPDKTDIVICMVRFNIASNVSGEVIRIPIVNIGSPGTGTGSEILTYDGTDYYYITPIRTGYGNVLLAEVPSLPIVSQSFYTPGTPSVGTAGSSTSYSFGATAGWPSGYTPRGRVWAWVNTYFDGEVVGHTKVELTADNVSHNYSGTSPLGIPQAGTGQITYEIVIETEFEEDSGFVYVFIKVGARFKLTTVITQKDHENIIIPLIIPRSEVDRIIINDFTYFYKEGVPQPVNIDYSDDITIDDYVVFGIEYNGNYTIFDVTNIYDEAYEYNSGVLKKGEAENVVISDEVDFYKD